MPFYYSPYHNGVERDVIVISGGDDFLEFDRVKFDHDLYIKTRFYGDDNKITTQSVMYDCITDTTDKATNIAYKLDFHGISPLYSEVMYKTFLVKDASTNWVEALLDMPYNGDSQYTSASYYLRNYSAFSSYIYNNYDGRTLSRSWSNQNLSARIDQSYRPSARVGNSGYYAFSAYSLEKIDYPIGRNPGEWSSPIRGHSSIPFFFYTYVYTYGRNKPEPGANDWANMNGSEYNGNDSCDCISAQYVQSSHEWSSYSNIYLPVQNISTFTKSPFKVNGVKLFDVTNPPDPVKSVPYPSLNRNPTTTESTVTVSYITFGETISKTVSIKVFYKERPCYNMYDGKTEKQVEYAKDWSNLKPKVAGINTNTQEPTYSENIYVLN